jgi:DNA modification methylase
MIINNIITGDALTALKTLPDNSINCCVTSPPYYGLRDYNTATWEGGDINCRHSQREEAGFENSKQSTNRGNSKNLPKTICPKCGATRIDKQIGVEDTPEQYIEHLTEVFAEVFRAMQPDGTLWLNIGDSYWGGKGYSGSPAGRYQWERHKAGKSITRGYSCIGGKGVIRPTDHKHESLKAKDLIGIPWMLAFALRTAGWYLRQDIICNKPNPMPESVADRCTKSHEYIFLLSKSAKYYFNNVAIKEKATSFDGRKATLMKGGQKYAHFGHTCAIKGHERWNLNADGDRIRNKRSVWTVNTKPYAEAHFATFPQKLIAPCILAGKLCNKRL